MNRDLHSDLMTKGRVTAHDVHALGVVWMRLTAHEVPMITTRSLPRRKITRNPKTKPSRPVTQLLLEIAYHLHATKVVSRIAPPHGR